jgi:hypothetical protein
MILAPIERLPIELLQQVFIESNHNTALPRASNYLGTRLSSDYVYHSACNYHLTEVHGKRAEQTTNQTYIFASRWMTWNFFKSWIIRRYEVNGCLCGLTPGEGCFDAQWPPNFEDATTMVFSRSHIPRIAFVKGRLPKKLLRAPWTQDKIEFLRFLLWITSMTVDWTDPETRQTTIEGRKQAMSEKNLAAVELFNHNRRLGKAADLETVRQAVVETGCDRSIVYDTLNAANTWNKSGLPRHSPQLHAWCEIQVAKGNPKGEWLRTKLEESSIWSSRATAESKLAESQMHVRVKTRPLNPKAGDYNGGPGDELVVHELEWNKVRKVSISTRRVVSLSQKYVSFSR